MNDIWSEKTDPVRGDVSTSLLTLSTVKTRGDTGGVNV